MPIVRDGRYITIEGAGAEGAMKLQIMATAEPGLFEVRVVGGGGNLFTREQAEFIVNRVNGKTREQMLRVVDEARGLLDRMGSPISGKSVMGLVEEYRGHFHGLNDALTDLEDDGFEGEVESGQQSWLLTGLEVRRVVRRRIGGDTIELSGSAGVTVEGVLPDWLDPAKTYCITLSEEGAG